MTVVFVSAKQAIIGYRLFEVGSGELLHIFGRHLLGTLRVGQHVRFSACCSYSHYFQQNNASFVVTHEMYMHE